MGWGERGFLSHARRRWRRRRSCTASWSRRRGSTSTGGSKGRTRSSIRRSPSRRRCGAFAARERVRRGRLQRSPGGTGGTLTCRPPPPAPRVARVTRPQVYVGNLSFYTSETQLYEVRTCATPVRGRANPSFRGSADRRVSKPTTMQVFSKVGEPKRIIMGLDRERRTPCGFCFIAYYTREVRLALHEGRVRRRTTADLSDANFSSLIGGRRPPSSVGDADTRTGLSPAVRDLDPPRSMADVDLSRSGFETSRRRTDPPSSSGAPRPSLWTRSAARVG